MSQPNIQESVTSEVKDLSEIMQKTWQSIYQMLPSIIVAIVLFIVGLILIKQFKNLAYKFIQTKSKDSLVSDFLVNVLALVLTLILLLVCLSILGWGNITDKILAGAGLTTFVIGFALKDIGENFLAGILMAFRRPFKIGDLIELNAIKGRVTQMTMRETMVRTLDGKEVFIPNGMILKNPLINHTYDNLLRNEFSLTIAYDPQTEKTIENIEALVTTFEGVEKTPAPSVTIEEINDDELKIKITYWYSTSSVKAPGNRLKTKIMLRVYELIYAENSTVQENE